MRRTLWLLAVFAVGSGCPGCFAPVDESQPDAGSGGGFSGGGGSAGGGSSTGGGGSTGGGTATGGGNATGGGGGANGGGAAAGGGAAGGGGGAGGAGTGLLPVSDGFQQQGAQQVKRNGVACSGRIAIGVGDQAVCFTHSDGSLRCAGQIFQSSFGPQFTAVQGISEIDQIFISMTANSATGNAICVHRTDHTAWCMGDANGSGQFGTGATGPQSGFVSWGGFTDIDWLTTGTWDQFCARRTGGEIECSGYGFGLAPVEPDTSLHQSAWVDTFGSVHLDDAMVLRPADGRSECKISAGKFFQCPMTNFGMPGTIVNGSGIEMGPMGSLICILDDAGKVQCNDLVPFDQRVVLALAGNPYTKDTCVVYDDGSLWCRGPNGHGELGAGNTQPLMQETQVQPPGSVRLGCP